MLEPPEEPFRWSDLTSLGITGFTLRRWLRDGRVRRVLTSVYCPSELPDNLATRAACAALILPPDAVLCDRSAAWLWGVDALAPDERFAVPDLEVAVSPDRSRLRRRGIRGVRRDLVTSEIQSVGEVYVTTPARTALDLACRRGRGQALAVLDGFMRQCGLTVDDLVAGLQRFRRRRGVTQSRELVQLASPLAESPGESWTRMAIIDAGLPAPELQVEVKDDGVVRFRLDLAYRRWRVAVEYDGEGFHGEEHAPYDEARRRWLRAHGWHVIVVRKGQFAGRAREDWLDELAHTINERSRGEKVRYARRPGRWVN